MHFLRIASVALALRAQESPQEPIRVSVKTVQLDVTVLDPSGKHVSGLGRERDSLGARLERAHVVVPGD